MHLFLTLCKLLDYSMLQFPQLTVLVRKRETCSFIH